jgi:hypothetical protein
MCDHSQTWANCLLLHHLSHLLQIEPHHMAEADHRDLSISIGTPNGFNTHLEECGEFLCREPSFLHAIPLEGSVQHGRDHTGVIILWKETLRETGVVRRGHRGTDFPETSHGADHIEKYRLHPTYIKNVKRL